MLVHKILDSVQVAISTGQREWGVTSLVDCIWITTMLVHKIPDCVQVAISTGQIEWGVTSLVDCTCKPQNCTLCWYTMIIIIVWVTAWPYYSTLVWPEYAFSWGTIFTFWIEAHSFHKTLDPVQPAIECTHWQSTLTFPCSWYCWTAYIKYTFLQACDQSGVYIL